jgi:hypothetical protein
MKTIFLPEICNFPLAIRKQGDLDLKTSNLVLSLNEKSLFLLTLWIGVSINMRKTAYCATVKNRPKSPEIN